MTLVVAGVIASILGFGPVSRAAPAIPATEARDLSVRVNPARSVVATLALPIRANMIGVSYRGAAATVRLRVHRPGEGWKPWQTLGSSDIGPDDWTGEGNDRVTTEPAWVGLADRVMVRVDAPMPVSDVRVHAINTSGDARPKNVLQRMMGFLASAPAAVAPAVRPANAVPAVPEVITRAGWGADERWRRCCPRYAPTVEVAFIHHTASPNNYSAAEVPNMIRGIYRYHRFNLDYDDIAYNVIIDRFGRVYEGRAGGLEKAVIAAHTEGMNTKTTGIALLGTFSNAYPSGPMMVSLMKFLAWKLDIHHIPSYGVVPMTSGGSAKLKRGQTVWMNRIAGHRDAQATDCPGNKMYYQLPRIRQTIMQWGSPKFYLNSTPRVLRADGDGKDEGPVEIPVWYSSELNYKIDIADASGAIKASFTGKGTKSTTSWNGRDQAGGRIPTGAGTITIEAWDNTNKYATKAVVPMLIVETHPAGTALSSPDSRVWIDDAGTARTIASDAVAASWFASSEIVPTGPLEPARYTAGLPLSFRDGTLARTPDGVLRFVNAGQRRNFATPAVAQALGFVPEGAIDVPQAEMDALPAGPSITDTTTHPAGSVVKESNGTTWVIGNGTKRRVPSDAVRRSWYRDAEVVPAVPGDLALPEADRVLFRPGSLWRTPGGRLWIISGGTRRLFAGEALFTAMGYRTAAVRDVSWADIGLMPYGSPV